MFDNQIVKHYDQENFSDELQKLIDTGRMPSGYYDIVELLKEEKDKKIEKSG